VISDEKLLQSAATVTIHQKGRPVLRHDVVAPVAFAQAPTSNNAKYSALALDVSAKTAALGPRLGWVKSTKSRHDFLFTTTSNGKLNSHALRTNSRRA
jgi:hypothetical protein